MTRLLFLSWLVLSPLLFGLSACSSTGASRSTASDGTVQPVVVSLRDYRSGIRFTVVNDAYLRSRGVEGENADLRKANFQSTSENDLGTKVTSDAAVDALLSYLDSEGFSSHASEGPAPPDGASSNRLTTSLEVTIGSQTRAWLFDVSWATTKPEPRALKQYSAARAGFMDFHGLIEQYASGTEDDWQFEQGRR